MSACTVDAVDTASRYYNCLRLPFWSFLLNFRIFGFKVQWRVL